VTVKTVCTGGHKGRSLSS